MRTSPRAAGAPDACTADDESVAYVTQYIYRRELTSDDHLLFNTLTGAVDVVPARVAELLVPRARCDTAALTAEEGALLRARGYLLAQDDERAQVAQWFSEFKARMRSWHFIVCPTFTCNLRCHYCYEPLEIRESRSALSAEQIDAMFAAMRRLVAEREAEDVNLEFFGGEPFLRSNRSVIASIVKHAAESRWLVSGITNGTQVDGYFELFERYHSSVAQIQVTLDGPQAIHDRSRISANGSGTYRSICKNVTGLLERRIPVALRVNTGTDNVAHLPELFGEFESMGWTSFPHFQCQIAPINDHSCTGCVANYQPEFELLRQLNALFPDWEGARERYHLTLGYDIERRTSLLRLALFGKISPAVRNRDLSGCSASNQHYVVFGADGQLYPCPETVGVAKAAIGRYFPDFEVDRAKWSKWDLNISNTAKCVDCNIAPVCGGACPWHGFNASSFDAYEPHCNYAQQTIKTYLDLNEEKLFAMMGLKPESRSEDEHQHTAASSEAMRCCGGD